MAKNRTCWGWILALSFSRTALLTPKKSFVDHDRFGRGHPTERSRVVSVLSISLLFLAGDEVEFFYGWRGREDRKYSNYHTKYVINVQRDFARVVRVCDDVKCCTLSASS